MNSGLCVCGNRKGLVFPEFSSDTLPLLFPLAGTCGDGQQRHIAISAGDRENQEPFVPQPNAGHEHREEAGQREQD